MVKSAVHSSVADTDLADTDLMVDFKPGDVVFHEGERGAEMFIVGEGEVELVKSFGAKETRVALLGTGDFFGETSVLEDLPRTVTARALSACRLLPIDVPTFDRLLREHPELTVRMLRQLSLRLRERDEQDERAHRAAAGVLSGALRLSPESLEPVSLPPLPRPSRPMACLLHGPSGRALEIRGDGKTLVGRLDPSTGQRPDVDLGEIDRQSSCSRRHAQIWASGGRFFLREEIGVGNGTWVNHQRLSAGKEHELRDGDHLRFGLLELVFKIGAGE